MLTTAETGVLALKSALDVVGGPLVVASAGFAALTGAIKSSLDTFAQDEQQIFKTGVVLRNLGSSFPLEELQAFGSELQKTVAIDDEAVVSLGGLLARFKLTGEQIKQTIPSIVDAAKATGLSLEEIGRAVGIAAETGQARGLRQLGIVFKDAGNEAKNLQAIVSQLNLRFAGAGVAERNTLSGSIEALTESFSNLQSSLGERIAPAVIGLLNAMTVAVDFLNSHIKEAIVSLGFLTNSPALVTLGLSTPPPNPANQVGTVGGGRTEAQLDAIEQNTRTTANALGGFGRHGITVREVNLAYRASR